MCDKLEYPYKKALGAVVAQFPKAQQEVIEQMMDTINCLNEAPAPSGGLLQFEGVYTPLVFKNIKTAPIEMLPPLPSNQYYKIIGMPTCVRKACTELYNFNFSSMGIFYDITQTIAEYSFNILPIMDAFSGFLLNEDYAINATYRYTGGNNTGFNSMNGKGLYIHNKGIDATTGDANIVVSFLYEIKTIPA